MSGRAAMAMMLALGTLWTGCALADESTSTSASSAPPPPAVPAAPRDDRLLLSADGARLTGTNGGGGGSIGYLHGVNADTLLGASADYQTIANAHWAFGSLNAAFSHALTDSTRWNVHAEAHEGAGHIGNTPFNYSIVAGGFGATTSSGFGADLEERQIDVDTSHGSLPKVGLSQTWGKHWLTAIAYAQSYGGNLNTEYSLARIDFYGPGFNLLGGGSVGRVSPAVLNLAGVLQPQARHLTEEFFGVTRVLARSELTLLADRIDLAGSERFTLTLNCTVHLR